MRFISKDFIKSVTRLLLQCILYRDLDLNKTFCYKSKIINYDEGKALTIINYLLEKLSLLCISNTIETKSLYFLFIILILIGFRFTISNRYRMLAFRRLLTYYTAWTHG